MYKRFAVFGSPIKHSMSPLIHYLLAKQAGKKIRYDKRLINPKDFPTAVKDFFATGGYGLNITSPLKELAYQYSDIQTERCKVAQAANTLWYVNGKIYADNTDGAGFILDLSQYIDIKSKNILIIGAGGAARGIIPAIESENPQSISIVNRSAARLKNLQTHLESRFFVTSASNSNNLPSAQTNITLLDPDQILEQVAGDINFKHQSILDKNYDIIINTTPSAASIITDTQLKQAKFCYDLTYQYLGTTSFEERAIKLNIPAKNGWGMLVNQAILAFNLWHTTNTNNLPLPT